MWTFYIIIFCRCKSLFDAVTLRCDLSTLVNPNNIWQFKQESLANAKVSARQPGYIGRNSLNRPPLRIAQQYQRNLYIAEKYFQCTTIPSLTLWAYLHWFSRCCLPNMPTSAKFRENLNAQQCKQCKVIQGQWFWYQSKAHIPISD